MFSLVYYVRRRRGRKCTCRSRPSSWPSLGSPGSRSASSKIVIMLILLLCNLQLQIVLRYFLDFRILSRISVNMCVSMENFYGEDRRFLVEWQVSIDYLKWMYIVCVLIVFYSINSLPRFQQEEGEQIFSHLRRISLTLF